MDFRSVERFTRGDRTLIVKRLGPVGGRQFVLVHGIGVSPRYFVRLARVLARSGGVIAVELPGHGAAPKPAAGMSIEDYADCVNGYLDSIGLDAPVLIGHSMGAEIVTEMSLRRPAVDRVVLIGAVVEPRRSSVASIGGRLLKDGFLEPPDVIWTEVSDYLRCGPRWYLKTVKAMMSYPMESALTRVSADVLAIRGSRDPIADRDRGQRMLALIPRVRLVEVMGRGHVVMQTAPEQVASEIVSHAELGVPAVSNGEQVELS